jgi:competence protein ComEC
VSHPALVPLVGLIAGTTAGTFFPPPPAALLRLLLLATWAGTLASVVRQRGDVFALCALMGFAAAGWGLASDASARAVNPSLRQIIDRYDALDEGPGLFANVEGVLRLDATPRPWGAGLALRVERVRVAGHWFDVHGGVRLTVVGGLVTPRVDAWRAGRRIQAPARLRRPSHHLDPGVPDAERRLAWRGTTLVGTVKSALLVEIVEPGTWVNERAAAVRHQVRRRLMHAVGRWDARSAAIITAILIGDRAGLDQDLELRLQEAGTYHVIAISGGNIAIFAAAIFWLLRRLRCSSSVATLATIACLAGYAWLVGSQPSVTRATVMAVTYLAARLLDHRADPTNVLAVATSAILCATPLAVADAGLALTCGATLALLVGASRLRRFAPRRAWLAAPVGLLAASLSAEVALFPVSAFVFSRVTFAGLFLNFLAVPLMTVGQVAGMTAIALSVVRADLAAAAGLVAHLAAWGLAESAAWVELVPWVSHRVPPPAPVVVVAYYLALATALFATTERAQTIWPRGRAHRWQWTAVSVAFVAAGWIVVEPVTAVGRVVGGRSTLRVTFLDVGQGDATLLQMPGSGAWLVDAGGGSTSFDVGARVVAPALWALGVRRLETLAITHGDPDHLGGAPSVVRDFAPRDIWYGVPVPQHEPTQALRALADRSSLAWRTVHAGDALRVAAAEVDVRHPPQPDWARQQVRNDDSLVLEVRHGRVSFVLPGDIGRDVERAIAPRFAPAGLRILKAAHHGSASSTSREFLEALRPDIVVFSSGRDNPYGHPAPDVVRRVEESGARIVRTDRDGAITVETDGEEVWIRTYTGRELTLKVTSDE